MLKTVEKVLADFSTETSALHALIVGIADNSHTGADRSYFSDAHVVGKIDLKCPQSGHKHSIFIKQERSLRECSLFLNFSISISAFPSAPIISYAPCAKPAPESFPEALRSGIG